MWQCWALSSTFILGVVYTFWTPDGEAHFSLSDDVIRLDTWWYFFFEHFRILVLSLVVLFPPVRFRMTVITFVILMGFDWMDFILSYNNARWRFISNNTIMPTIYFVVFAIDYIRWKLKQLE